MQHRLRQIRFRTAVALYLGCVVLFFVPYWGMGQVLAPSCRSTVLTDRTNALHYRKVIHGIGL